MKNIEASIMISRDDTCSKGVISDFIIDIYNHDNELVWHSRLDDVVMIYGIHAIVSELEKKFNDGIFDKEYY